jgi:diguanylate cyclase (GGDEF)-like protein
MLARDNTEQKELEEKLERQALYDPLTGLANRALFMDHLEQAIARADRNNQLVAALFMDLDNFKRINDTYGHLAGDHVLAEIANRLRAAIRANDTAARLSGDEFSVLIEDVATEQDVMTVTSRILRALRATVELDGDVIYTTVSIGVAFNTARPVTGVDMLRNADRALYHAKARGKDCVAIYDKSINVVVWNADEETAAGAAPGTGVDGLLAHVGEPDVSEVVPAPPVPMAEAAAAPPAPEPPPMPEHEPAAVDALPPAPAAPPPSTPAAMPDDYADDGLVDRIAALEIQIARLAAGLERPALPRRHGHDDNG